MNVEIVTEATQFPEKEYINGIFLAVYKYTFIYLIQSTKRKPLVNINIYG
jgi:hypothetical protein